MDNQFNYTILPCGLKHSSVKEIVDAYNNLSGESRQYEDLIFVRNNTLITQNIQQGDGLDKNSFGIIKVLISKQHITQEFNGIDFVNHSGSQSYNFGLSLFHSLNADDGRFYCDFSIFKFK